MIKLLEKRIKGAADIGKILNPAFFLFDLTGEMDFNSERMAVQTPTFVILGEVRQQMRGLDGEKLEYFHKITTA